MINTNNNLFLIIEDINNDILNIYNENHFNYFIETLYDLFNIIDVKTLDNILLELLMYKICSNIHLFIMNNNITLYYSKLIELLKEKNWIPNIYIKQFNNILNSKIICNLSLNLNYDEINLIREKIENLFNYNKNEKRKNGISLIDFEGNFIWFDDLSFKFFEAKYNFKKKMNIFNWMIPDSINLLKSKFNNEIIKLNSDYDKNSFVSFSYTIYSENSVNLFIKNTKINYKNNKNLNYNNNNNKIIYSENEKIYFKYLKSLRSRAKVLLITITKSDINYFEKAKKNYFNFELLKKLLGNKKEITIKALFLETKLNKNIQDLDFNTLIKDKKISEFNEKINISLKKIRKKKLIN